MLLMAEPKSVRVAVNYEIPEEVRDSLHVLTRKAKRLLRLREGPRRKIVLKTMAPVAWMILEQLMDDEPEMFLDLFEKYLSKYEELMENSSSPKKSKSGPHPDSFRGGLVPPGIVPPGKKDRKKDGKARA